jgi:hypothetical protein
MARVDIPGKWAGTVQFAVISTPRSLKLASLQKGAGNLGAIAWEYVEIDNRPNKGATLYVAFNGRTASSVLDSTFITGLNAQATLGADGKHPNFRIRPDTIERISIRATSVSVVATGATTIFLNVARF